VEVVQKVALDWGQLGLYISKIGQQISLRHKGEMPFTSVMGVSRGGLPLGIAMSHKLDLPFVPVSVRSYTDSHRREAIKCDTPPEVFSKCSGHVLICDDLTDSGKTMDFLMNTIWETTRADITVAALFYKETSIVKPDFFVEVTDKWIVFPWEV